MKEIQEHRKTEKLLIESQLFGGRQENELFKVPFNCQQSIDGIHSEEWHNDMKHKLRQSELYHTSKLFPLHSDAKPFGHELVLPNKLDEKKTNSIPISAVGEGF